MSQRNRERREERKQQPIRDFATTYVVRLTQGMENGKPTLRIDGTAVPLDAMEKMLETALNSVRDRMNVQGMAVA